MKNYKIPVTYTIYGYVEIDADNFDDAVDIVKQDVNEDTIIWKHINFEESSIEIDDERLLEFETKQII